MKKNLTCQTNLSLTFFLTFFKYSWRLSQFIQKDFKKTVLSYNFFKIESESILISNYKTIKLNKQTFVYSKFSWMERKDKVKKMKKPEKKVHLIFFFFFFFANRKAHY